MNLSFVPRVISRTSSLLPIVREKALLLVAACADQGLGLRIVWTYRSYAEQAAIYSQGRDPMQKVNDLRRAAGLPLIMEPEASRIVTKAKPGRSWHNWRRALDVVPVDSDVSPDFSDKDNPIWNSPHWEAVGQVGEMLGFEWGGRWTNKDWGHFEYHADGATFDDLLRQYPEGI